MSKSCIVLLLLLGQLDLNAQDSLHRYFINGITGAPFYEFTYHTSVDEGKPDKILVEVDNLIVDSVHAPFKLIEMVVKATSHLAMVTLIDASSYRLYHGANPLLSIGIFEKGEKIHIPSTPSLYISWKFMGNDEHGSMKIYQMYSHFDLKGNLINYKTL